MFHTGKFLLDLRSKIYYKVLNYLNKRVYKCANSLSDTVRYEVQVTVSNINIILLKFQVMTVRCDVQLSPSSSEYSFDITGEQLLNHVSTEKFKKSLCLSCDKFCLVDLEKCVLTVSMH